MKVESLRKSGQFSIQYSREPFLGNLIVVFQTCCVVLLLLTVSFADAAKVEDFIPKESVFYVKLQNIDEVYNEIETSENWEKALGILTATPNWQEMQQGLAMIQVTMGTDVLGIVETVGYRTALAAWKDEADSLQVGIVIHSGGNLARLQQLTKIVEGLIGMDSDNTLRLDAGVYQRVRYNAMERFGLIVKYGFVGEFLVIGANEGSFEKLMDTYKTDMPSVEENPKFAGEIKRMGSGEVVVFADVPHTLSLPIGLEESLQTRLSIFQFVYGRLNLLETGPFLQVAAELSSDLPENQIGIFLKEGQQLKTLNALSSEDDLFVAASPGIVESLWEFAPIDADPDAISFFEGLLHLNLEDIIVGLTGELALSIPDFRDFDPEALSGFRFKFDRAIELDAGDVETGGCLILNPSNQIKWDQIGNSLSNLQNASVSQTVYQGATVSAISSNIYHSTVDGLFLIGFSEEQVYTLIDQIKGKKRPSYLKQLPKTPTAFAQLNLARTLEIEKGSPPADKLIVNSKEIAPIIAWITVKEDKALLEATSSQNETALQVLAKLVPFFVWNMEQE